MTDGPHKSLPMTRPWKKAAERAGNDCFELADVADFVLRALSSGVDRRFLARVRKAVSPREQGSLFIVEPDLAVHGLRALSADCSGSNFQRNLLDACVARVRGGASADSVLETALTYALQQEERNHARGIEEHWLRSQGGDAGLKMRERLSAVRAVTRFGHLASEMMNPPTRPSSRTQAPKRTGLDEGVAL